MNSNKLFFYFSSGKEYIKNFTRELLRNLHIFGRFWNEIRKVQLWSISNPVPNRHYLVERWFNITLVKPKTNFCSSISKNKLRNDMVISTIFWFRYESTNELHQETFRKIKVWKKLKYNFVLKIFLLYLNWVKICFIHHTFHFVSLI